MFINLAGDFTANDFQFYRSSLCKELSDFFKFSRSELLHDIHNSCDISCPVDKSALLIRAAEPRIFWKVNFDTTLTKTSAIMWPV